MFLSIPPKLSLSDVMQRIKGRSSRRIQMEFPELRKRYWGRRFWARGYFSTTSGNVTDDIIMQYLELQKLNRAWFVGTSNPGTRWSTMSETMKRNVPQVGGRAVPRLHRRLLVSECVTSSQARRSSARIGCRVVVGEGSAAQLAETPDISSHS